MTNRRQPSRLPAAFVLCRRFHVEVAADVSDHEPQFQTGIDTAQTQARGERLRAHLLCLPIQMRQGFWPHCHFPYPGFSRSHLTGSRDLLSSETRPRASPALTRDPWSPPAGGFRITDASVGGTWCDERRPHLSLRQNGRRRHRLPGRGTVGTLFGTSRES